MISNQVTTEKLLQVYYYLKYMDVDIDRNRENIFKDDELTGNFCDFLKNYFKMKVLAGELSCKETLGEALDALIPYLPEDTTRLYFNMATIYSVICESLDDQVAELFMINKKVNIAKIGAIAGMLISVIYLTVGAWNINVESVLSAYNLLEQMKPFAWFSSSAWFYLCIMLMPIISAFLGGALSCIIYRLYRYVRYRI